MVNEDDLRSRYAACAGEIVQLDREIELLQLQVRMGSEHWHHDLERLAKHARRRQELEAQRETLGWVLAPDGGEQA